MVDEEPSGTDSPQADRRLKEFINYIIAPTIVKEYLADRCCKKDCVFPLIHESSSGNGEHKIPHLLFVTTESAFQRQGFFLLRIFVFVRVQNSNDHRGNVAGVRIEEFLD